MILKVAIEVTLLLFIISVWILLVFLRQYIRLLNKEIVDLSENTKTLAELEGMNLELLKYIWDFFNNVRVQKVDGTDEGTDGNADNTEIETGEIADTESES